MIAVCSRCKTESTLSLANLSRVTGKRLYRSWCIQCEKKRKDIWRINNKARHNKNSATWYANNTGKGREIKRKWNTNNQAKARTARKTCRDKNPEHYKAYTNARRNKLRLATPKWLGELDRLVISEIYHLAQLRKLTVDHVVPLQGENVCGLHVPWNLQLLPAKDNYSKSNKLPT